MINCTIPMQKYSSLSGLYSESLELGLRESLSHKETVRLTSLCGGGGGGGGTSFASLVGSEPPGDLALHTTGQPMPAGQMGMGPGLCCLVAKETERSAQLYSGGVAQWRQLQLAPCNNCLGSAPPPPHPLHPLLNSQPEWRTELSISAPYFVRVHSVSFPYTYTYCVNPVK